MAPEASEADRRVSDAPCPRCGCWMAVKGQDELEFCGNCGRYTILGPTEFTELGIYDKRCGAGKEFHAHGDFPKAAKRASHT